MKLVALALGVAVWGSLFGCEGLASRRKRDVWQFGHLIQCAHRLKSRIPFWSFLTYNNYGCYCGYGGKGRPVDQIDRCCYHHDKCYERVRKNYCIPSLWIYLALYNYDCKHGKISCNDPCPWKRDLCRCDQQAAYCFAKHHKRHYNASYKNMRKYGRCDRWPSTEIN